MTSALVGACVSKTRCSSDMRILYQSCIYDTRLDHRLFAPDFLCRARESPSYVSLCPDGCTPSSQFWPSLVHGMGPSAVKRAPSAHFVMLFAIFCDVLFTPCPRPRTFPPLAAFESWTVAANARVTALCCLDGTSWKGAISFLRIGAGLLPVVVL